MGSQRVRHDWVTELNWMTFPESTQPQVICSGQGWGSVKSSFPRLEEKVTWLMEWAIKTSVCETPMCPNERSRKQRELSLLHSDVFLLGGQKSGTKFLGTLNSLRFPSFTNVLFQNSVQIKISKESQVSTWVWELEIRVETKTLLLPGKCCQIQKHANVFISSGL